MSSPFGKGNKNEHFVQRGSEHNGQNQKELRLRLYASAYEWGRGRYGADQAHGRHLPGPGLQLLRYCPRLHPGQKRDGPEGGPHQPLPPGEVHPDGQAHRLLLQNPGGYPALLRKPAGGLWGGLLRLLPDARPERDQLRPLQGLPGLRDRLPAESRGEGPPRGHFLPRPGGGAGADPHGVPPGGGGPDPVQLRGLRGSRHPEQKVLRGLPEVRQARHRHGAGQGRQPGEPA